MLSAISASEARKDLLPLIDRVNNDHTPIEIVSKRGNAVLVSKQDRDAIVETNYLLRSPANAKRLTESVEQWRSGRTTARDLEPDASNPVGPTTPGTSPAATTTSDLPDIVRTTPPPPGQTTRRDNALRPSEVPDPSSRSAAT